MGPSDLRKLPDIGEILAAISSAVQVYGHLPGRGDFVNDVIDDAARQQIALGAVLPGNPHGSINKAKSSGNRFEFGIGRDEGIEGRIRSGDAERMGRSIRRSRLCAGD
jgi:hypothetical protein